MKEKLIGSNQLKIDFNNRTNKILKQKLKYYD